MTTPNALRALRDDYLRGGLSFQDYYCRLADALGITENLIPFTLAQLHASVDAAFNDLPLHRWDSRHADCLWLSRWFGLPGWSISESVCCLKALARRRLERDRLILDLAALCPDTS